MSMNKRTLRSSTQILKSLRRMSKRPVLATKQNLDFYSEVLAPLAITSVSNILVRATGGMPLGVRGASDIRA